MIFIFPRFEREGYDDLDFECTEKGFANFHVKIDLVSFYVENYLSFNLRESELLHALLTLFHIFPTLSSYVTRFDVHYLAHRRDGNR